MKKFLTFLLVTIFVFLLSTLVFLFLLNSKYTKWEKEFESNLDSRFVVDRYTDLDQLVSERVSKYVLSEEMVDSLQLSPREIGSVVLGILRKYNSENFSFDKVYIIPDRSEWEVCTEISFRSNSLTPWICMKLNKDNIQTAQLYVSEVNIGPFSIGDKFDILDQINEGLSRSLLTVNENGFSGRYFENIELLENAIVIKGSQY